MNKGDIMNAAKETFAFLPLQTECERIELLAHCLLSNRNGKEAGEELLKKLKNTQNQVSQHRAPNGYWEKLGITGLTSLEYDVLSSAIAVEVLPRVGLMFQSLQPGAPQPYPTQALLHDLLAVGTHEIELLRSALDENGALRKTNLIQCEDGGPFQPIRPHANIIARVLGRAIPMVVPPGAIPVRQKPHWEDLVLPEDRKLMLREFLLWVRYKQTVVNEWGGSEIGGPIALFAGPSGTGKTLAAAVLANEMGWPLFRVDLGKLVSKYIGETEKNLNQLFDAAHGQPMVLQFDEADSLFSKRGEIREARDRYANMEVSHLLSRIECHDGPCILTTNLRSHLDQAFARRFQMVVHFPRPDNKARAQLWRRLLPPRAPRDDGVDPAFLGNAVNLTGGNIRNAALHAAFLAAGENRPISMKHIAVAVWRELAKQSVDVSLPDMGSLAKFLEGGHVR